MGNVPHHRPNLSATTTSTRHVIQPGQHRPATKQLIDDEAQRIIDNCYTQALATLRKHRHQLDRLTHTLLQRETLDENEAYQTAGLHRETAPAAITRSETPGTEPAPSLPPEDAPANTQDGLPLRTHHDN
jgi:cell division protease FtsH